MSRPPHLRRGAACALSRQGFQSSAFIFLFCCLEIAALLAPALASAQKNNQGSKRITWKETDTETLWTARFAHCDYGFIVILPRNFVGHGNRSPNPCHGFLVGLPDPSTTNPVGIEDERFIWVNAEYNSFDLKSLQEAANWQIEISGSDKQDFKVITRNATKLYGLPAVRVRYQYRRLERTVIEEQVISLRAGILYELGLRTTPDDYETDRSQFTKIVSNFRWWRIHYCP